MSDINQKRYVNINELIDPNGKFIFDPIRNNIDQIIINNNEGMNVLYQILNNFFNNNMNEKLQIVTKCCVTDDSFTKAFNYNKQKFMAEYAQQFSDSNSNVNPVNIGSHVQPMSFSKVSTPAPTLPTNSGGGNFCYHVPRGGNVPIVPQPGQKPSGRR